MRLILLFSAFLSWALLGAQPTPCKITDMTAEVVLFDSVSCEYYVEINFSHMAVTNQFQVFDENGNLLGKFTYSQLPVKVGPFNAGPAPQTRVFVVSDAVIANCAAEAEADVPGCVKDPCEIKMLTVEPDTCTSDSTFSVWLNFVHGPALDSFQVWADGVIIGKFGADQLPLWIGDYPWNKGIFSTIKVCTDKPASANSCCQSLQFLVPNCLPFGPCEVYDISVKTGPCASDSTYQITLNFQASNPGLGTFQVWTNGEILGVFDLTQVPLQYSAFPASGDSTDVISVCMEQILTVLCCDTLEFKAPDCSNFGQCQIKDLQVTPGPCNNATPSYSLKIDFDVMNPGADSFAVYTLSGLPLGVFPLSGLPLTIPQVPCTNNSVSGLTICIASPDSLQDDCCETIMYMPPQCCFGGPACEIKNLVVDTGDCTSDSTYQITVNFTYVNPPGAVFALWVNGTAWGTYNVADLPLTLDILWGGGSKDEIKVCFVNPGAANTCCKTVAFDAPDCFAGNCQIEDLEIGVGVCDSLSGAYSITLDFDATNPSSDSFVVATLNGFILGKYALSDLPVIIDGVPCANTPDSKLRVCIPGLTPNAICCALAEYPTPQCCFGGPACEIKNLVVDTGDCTSDSTYQITVNFTYVNPPGAVFALWVNGTAWGTYNVADLPLTLDILWGGGSKDEIKVCFVNPGAANTCCKTVAFDAPDCFAGNCQIKNLKVTTGPCNNAAPTYSITLDFDVTNPPDSNFVVTTLNGFSLGTYPLSALPVTITGVPCVNQNASAIRICIPGTDSLLSCCKIVDYPTPQCCAGGGACEIKDVTITPGNCYQNSVTYPLTLNFTAVNPTSNTFEVWTGTGMYLGAYQLSQLPVTIPQVLCANNPRLKICIKDNPSCCKIVEYQAPPCCNPSGQCEIFNLTVETGDCTTDSTYQVWINFDVVSSSPVNTFHLWANNAYWGEFSLNLLPFQINDFPWDGGAADFVKICLSVDTLGGGAFTCCRTRSFPVPDCIKGGCEIENLVVQTGQCTSDSTFEVWINFDHIGVTPNGMFGLWANGQYLGMYGLSQLPLYIPDFPWNGDVEQVLKVCVGVSSTNIQCCKTIEFKAPDCIVDECLIWDLQALATPCLCGEFFAILTFQHKNGGAMGYDIIGNSVNYGNFPYGHVQPIILGPLVGDAMTEYEFVVRDHLDNDCKDAFKLGKIDCTVGLQQPGAQPHSLILSPNPAADWLNVTALLAGGGRPGVSTVEVFHADGRRVMLRTVEDGGSFRLDVSALPAGIYRLSLRTAFGAVDGVFAK